MRKVKNGEKKEMDKLVFNSVDTSYVLNDLLRMVALYDGIDTEFAAGVKATYSRVFSTLGFRYEVRKYVVVLRGPNGDVLCSVNR